MSRKLMRQYGAGQGVLVDQTFGIVLDWGPTVPTDTSIGYAPGCIFIDINAAAGSQVFINEGSGTSSDFNAVAATGAGSFTSITSSGDLTFSAAKDINVPANTAATFDVDDGTTTMLRFDSRNTVKDTNTVTITGQPVTVASEAAAHVNASLAIAAKTITYTGTTGTTSSLGGQLWIGALTITDASMMTLSTASSVHIVAMAAAGGMLTITNSRMISTSVSDCFLTNAGVWTDTACWASGKKNLSRAAKKTRQVIEDVLAKLQPATWKYKKTTALPMLNEDGSESIHRTPINDRDRQRVGIVYDDLPEELLAPGEERAVAPSILSSFALAAIKHLWEKNQQLEARLEKLGA